MLGKYNLLRKCLRRWKTLFFHMVGISVVNSFILFKEYQKANPYIQLLKRDSNYSLLDFREELVRDIMEFEKYENPPVFKFVRETTVFTSEHIPEFRDIKKQCQVCYLKEKSNIEFTHAIQHHNAM